MGLELDEEGEEDVQAQLKHLVHVGYTILIKIQLDRYR